MKKSEYPEWVKPFDKKGYTVRVVKGAYWLFKASSRRVPEKSYPVTTQEFIGILDPIAGLIPKKVSIQDSTFLEYGLSHFMYVNHSRELLRSIYGYSGELGQNVIKAAIVFFVFGDVDFRYLKMSDLTIQLTQKTITKLQEIKGNRIANLVKKADEIFKKDFGDDANYMMNKLKMIQTPKGTLTPIKIDEMTLSMIRERGFKYD